MNTRYAAGIIKKSNDLNYKTPHKPTTLPADEVTELAKWLAPHVEAIEKLLARFKERGSIHTMRSSGNVPGCRTA